MINVIIGMPSGTGKSTHAKSIEGVYDIDEIFAEDKKPQKTKDELAALRRVAIDTGNWDDYQKIYVPYVKHAIDNWVETHGPIPVLLAHGRATFDKAGYEGFDYHAVVRDPTQHMIDLARRIKSKKDDPLDMWQGMAIGAANAMSVIKEDNPTMVKTYDDVKKFIISKIPEGVVDE